MCISIKLLIFSESRKRKLNVNGCLCLQIKILAQWKFLKNTIQTNYCNIQKLLNFVFYVKSPRTKNRFSETSRNLTLMSTYKTNKMRFVLYGIF